MNLKEDVYRRLQQHLDKWPLGFPPTEEGWELQILEEIYSPEEAEIAARLPFKFITLDVVGSYVDDLGYSRDQIEKIIDNLKKKGILIIVTNPKTKQKNYRNRPFSDYITGFRVKFTCLCHVPAGTII